MLLLLGSNTLRNKATESSHFLLNPICCLSPTSWPLKETPTVLVSQGCDNKATQTGWLEMIEIYSLTILEAGSSKSRCWQSNAPSEDSGQESFLASSSFWWPDCPLACGCTAPASASVHLVPPPLSVSLCPLLLL